MPSAKKFATSVAPHIRDNETAAGIYWKRSASLLPVFLAALTAFPFSAIKILSVSIGVSLAAEWAVCLFIRKKFQGWNGSSVYLALVLSLFFPPHISVWLAAGACFFMIVVFKELTGGIGHYLFHPALATLFLLQVFFSISFETALTAAEFMRWQTPLFNFNAAVLGTVSFPAIIISGFGLIVFRVLRPEIPFFYLLGVLLTSLMPLSKNAGEFTVLFNSTVMLFAFIVLSEDASMPLGLAGRKTFALLAGSIGFYLSSNGFGAQGYVCAYLLISAGSAWLDAKPKPKHSDKQSKK